MAIPNKQIGWSQESNLIWEISRQLEKLIQVASAAGGGPTPPTPGIDDVLAVNQSLTTSRQIEIGGGNVLEINPSTGNNVNLKLDVGSGITTVSGDQLLLKGSSSLTLDFVGAGVLKIDNAQLVPSGTATNVVDQLPVFIDGTQFYIQLYKV
jgi:hypothetical protein